MSNNKIQFKFKYEVRKHKNDTSFKTVVGTKKIVIDNTDNIPVDIKSIQSFKTLAETEFINSLYSNDILVDLNTVSIKVK